MNGLLIIDAHLDLAWNALSWNRDITRPVHEIRAAESGMTELGRGTNTVSLPEMRAGGVGFCLATLLARWNPAGASILDWKSQEIAEAAALGQLAYYRLLERRREVRFVCCAADLQDFHSPVPVEAPAGIIVSMEGADPIASPEDIPLWFDRGLRVIGPVHYGAGVYAHGTGTEGGLTARGGALLRAMHTAGMVLDVTHLADEAFSQALDLFEGFVLASHHNCRSLVPGQRQLSDAQIRSLVARKAVIGIAFDAWMLSPEGWTRGQSSNAGLTMERAVDHIEHVCGLAGNADHVAIGSDLDGGFGSEQCPRDLNSIADLSRLPDLLTARGFDDAAVRSIMHGNWLRFFERAWSAR